MKLLILSQIPMRYEPFTFQPRVSSYIIYNNMKCIIYINNYLFQRGGGGGGGREGGGGGVTREWFILANIEQKEKTLISIVFFSSVS